MRTVTFAFVATAIRKRHRTAAAILHAVMVKAVIAIQVSAVTFVCVVSALRAIIVGDLVVAHSAPPIIQANSAMTTANAMR